MPRGIYLDKNNAQTQCSLLSPHDIINVSKQKYHSSHCQIIYGEKKHNIILNMF